MARGQKKSIEEKITEKQNLIEALETRVRKEKLELEAMYEEKKAKEVECLTELLRDAHLSVDEAKEVLEQYINNTSKITA